MSIRICGICGEKHSTGEHQIHQSLGLSDTNVPINHLFLIDGELSGDEKKDARLKEIRALYNGEWVN